MKGLIRMTIMGEGWFLFRNIHESIQFTPNHENRPLCQGPPLQDLSEAWQEGSFFEFFVTNPPRGLPSGGGSIQRTRWIVG